MDLDVWFHRPLWTFALETFDADYPRLVFLRGRLTHAGWNTNASQADV